MRKMKFLFSRFIHGCMYGRMMHANFFTCACIRTRASIVRQSSPVKLNGWWGEAFRNQFDIRISVLNELAIVFGAKILVMQYLKIRKRHNLLCVFFYFLILYS